MKDSAAITAGVPPSWPVKRREIAAWAFFDFANSGFVTVVLTTIYSAYFVGVVAAGLDERSPGSATLMWTLAVGCANLLVLLGGPVVGAIADQHACKKRFLLVTSLICVAGTVLLAGAQPGQVTLSMGLVVVATLGFAFGENLIAAFLPEIAEPEAMGKISGYGWSLGYFGGLLTLGCCLAYINYSESQGLGATHFVPVSLLITAALFVVTAIPTFVWLRERATPLLSAAGGSVRHHWQEGVRQVRNTLREASRLPDLFRFLLCVILFQAGVATVVAVAAIFAQEVMGFDSKQLIVMVMVVNLTAAVGALAFGYVQDYFGSVVSLAGALVLWIVAIAVAMGAESEAEVWLTANLIGLGMGSTQTGGRALIGRLTPEARSAEVFGLWGLANRAAAILGPVSYGLISSLSAGNHRMAMLSTAAFFLAGLMLLLTVKESRGRAAAEAMTAREPLA